EALAEEGARSVYRGSLAEALIRLDGVVFTADDLRSYRPAWRGPVGGAFHEFRVATRGGLSGGPELPPRPPRLPGPAERAPGACPASWGCRRRHGCSGSSQRSSSRGRRGSTRPTWPRSTGRAALAC